jgi:hypothetical protein
MPIGSPIYGPAFEAGAAGAPAPLSATLTIDVDGTLPHTNGEPFRQLARRARLRCQQVRWSTQCAGRDERARGMADDRRRAIPSANRSPITLFRVASGPA